MYDYIRRIDTSTIDDDTSCMSIPVGHHEFTTYHGYGQVSDLGSSSEFHIQVNKEELDPETPDLGILELHLLTEGGKFILIEIPVINGEPAGKYSERSSTTDFKVNSIHYKNIVDNNKEYVYYCIDVSSLSKTTIHANLWMKGCSIAKANSKPVDGLTKLTAVKNLLVAGEDYGDDLPEGKTHVAGNIFYVKVPTTTTT